MVQNVRCRTVLHVRFSNVQHHKSTCFTQYGLLIGGPYEYPPQTFRLNRNTATPLPPMQSPLRH